MFYFMICYLDLSHIFAILVNPMSNYIQQDSNHNIHSIYVHIMSWFNEAEDFKLISEGPDTRDLGLVVFTIKRLENILRNHFVVGKVSPQLSFGKLVAECLQINRETKRCLFGLSEIRNELVHKMGCYSFPSDQKRITFIKESNKAINTLRYFKSKNTVIKEPEAIVHYRRINERNAKLRSCETRIFPSCSFVGLIVETVRFVWQLYWYIIWQIWSRVRPAGLSEEEVCDFNELLESFPEIKHKVKRNEEEIMFTKWKHEAIDCETMESRGCPDQSD